MRTNRKHRTLLGMIALMSLLVLLLAACGAPKSEAAGEIPRPSNAGGPGQAVDLTGDSQKGAQIFTDNCASCHGQDGKGGVSNPGSDDGTVPPLNPIDPGIKSPDQKTFATNIDLFVQHGSTPEGDNPALKMPAFGDNNTISQQEIADVIAYIISLNK